MQSSHSLQAVQLGVHTGVGVWHVGVGLGNGVGVGVGSIIASQ